MRLMLALVGLLSIPVYSQVPGYSNKLAPFVASPDRVVDQMLDLAKVKPGETVFDLGAGDGRILIAAVQKYKAKAVGVEISPKLVAEANRRISRAGVSELATVIQGDARQADVSSADVVTLYLETNTNADLRPQLEKLLKPGARVVSHDYPMPGWKATRVEKLDGRQGHMIYLYEMPPTKQP
jgi:cyclopropane fatty-acyl-phospholipid synthase-like methyltransferase